MVRRLSLLNQGRDHPVKCLKFLFGIENARARLGERYAVIPVGTGSVVKTLLQCTIECSTAAITHIRRFLTLAANGGDIILANRIAGDAATACIKVLPMSRTIEFVTMDYSDKP